MANRLEFREDDEMSEILRRAVRLQGSTSSDLSQRLAAVAAELGISPEAVAQAEIEYRQESSRQEELALYKKESRNGLAIHFGVFVIVNLFMVGLNLVTFQDDKEIWFQYVLMSWAVGLAIHAFIYLRKADYDCDEFQKWRAKRAARRAFDA